jgi:hypothetical protein
LTTTRRREADMPNLSWDFSFLEKFRYPPLAALCGLLVGLGLGGWGSWTTLSAVHEREVNDLHRQVAALEAAKTTNEGEMARLREQLTMLSPQRREADAKRRRELERFIQGVDKEISERKVRLARMSGGSRECDPRGENCRWVRWEDRPMNDAEKRAERELDALNVQRHEARKKLIEVIAQ